MTEPREHLTTDDFAKVVHAAFAGAALRSADRLTGGTKKGVYRLTLDDGRTVIAYVWRAAENYWPGAPSADDPTDPFGHATGVELFESAHAQLAASGVRVPRVFLLDRDQKWIDGDIALLEDIRGGSLESLLARDPVRAESVLARLGESVRAIHRRRSTHYGRPAVGVPPDPPPIERIVLNRALEHLRGAAARVDRIAAAEQRLAEALHHRSAAIRPRATYGLIHSELGADHVFVDERDEPVFIDIEGMMFFDIEWEHAFLELRFGEHYRQLVVDDLDEDRLRFYRLATYLSLVEGPLRLLDGDFPDRAGMLGIAEDNIRRTLAELDR